MVTFHPFPPVFHHLSLSLGMDFNPWNSPYSGFFQKRTACRLRSATRGGSAQCGTPGTWKNPCRTSRRSCRTSRRSWRSYRAIKAMAPPRKWSLQQQQRRKRTQLGIFVGLKRPKKRRPKKDNKTQKWDLSENGYPSFQWNYDFPNQWCFPPWCHTNAQDPKSARRLKRNMLHPLRRWGAQQSCWALHFLDLAERTCLSIARKARTQIFWVSQNQRSVNVRFWSLYPQVFVDVGYSWVQNQDIYQPRKKTISQDIHTKYLNYLKLSQKMVHNI